jgi:hypothetical protein
MNITDVHIGLNETSPFMSTNADDSASKTPTMDPYYHFNTVLVSKLCQGGLSRSRKKRAEV